MMRNKKFFAKALAFAMVMGTVGIHGAAIRPAIILEAADAKAPSISVDYTTYEAVLTLDKTSDTTEDGKYVCLQVLKDASGSKISGEYWYEVDGTDKDVTIDLSFLKATKAQYIRAYSIKGGASETFTVKAQPKTYIKYDAKKQAFVDKTKAEISATDLAGKYEYKSLYSGSWVAAGTNAGLTLLDLDTTTLAGTTILVRTAASSAFSIGDTPTASVDTDTPAGSEVKVKIPAVAKAPKVKVDYAKGIITLPKGVEAKLESDTDFVSVTGKLTPSDLLKKLGKDASATMATGFNLVVRTAEVSGKKAASNLTIVAVKPAVTLTVLNNHLTVDPSGSTKTVKITDNSSGANITLSEKNNAPGTITVAYAKATGTTAVDSIFTYSLDDGKTWKKLTTAASTDIDVKDATKLKISVEAAEGTFAPEEVEVTYKRSVNS